MGRVVGLETKAVEWAAEKEELRKALEAKDEMLKGEVSKKTSLAADLEKAQAKVGQLREEVSKNASLAADLEKAQAAVEQLEADLESQSRANIELVSQRNQVRTQSEAALEQRAAELESTLAKQKAELEEK